MRLIFHCLLLLWCVAASAAQPIQLQDGEVTLTPHVEHLIDPQGKLSITDIVQPEINAQFAPSPDALHRYNDGTVVWLKMTVQQTHTQPREWWLEVQIPSAIEQLAFYYPQDLIFYFPREDGTVFSSADASAAGSAVQDTEYRNPLFSIPLQDAQPHTFYLKVKPGLVAIKELRLWQPATFAKAVAREELLWGVYLGICALMVLTSIWFERAIRDGVYLAFAVYVMSVMMMFIPDTGMLREYFGQHYTAQLNFIRFMSHVVGMVACTEFFARFIRLREFSPVFTRYYLGGVRIFALVVAGMALAGYLQMAINVISAGIAFVVVPSSVMILFKQALRGSADLRPPFLLTAVLFGMSISIQFFAVNGYVRSSHFIDYSSAMVSVVFFLTIYYVIIRHYQRMREMTEDVQFEMLEMVKSAERELEKHVGERTHELLQAMEEVEKELSQEREAYEEQRQFMAMVSHELRTPLAVIDAAAQNMTREESHTSHKTAARLQKIQNATDRLSSLFGRYLNSPRLETPLQKVQCQETPLRPLLDDAVQVSISLSGKHMFAIDTDNMTDMLWCDATLLRLVLSTLVHNAVKYTPSGTRITLTGSTTSQGWHIDVTDTGKGISAKDKTRIFNRFYRGDASVNSSGTGLGLSLARSLIERQGGTLTLLETNVPGATFRIFLPKK